METSTLLIKGMQNMALAAFEQGGKITVHATFAMTYWALFCAITFKGPLVPSYDNQ